MGPRPVDWSGPFGSDGHLVRPGRQLGEVLEPRGWRLEAELVDVVLDLVELLAHRVDDDVYAVVPGDVVVGAAEVAYLLLEQQPRLRVVAFPGPVQGIGEQPGGLGVGMLLLLMPQPNQVPLAFIVFALDVLIVPPRGIRPRAWLVPPGA